MDLFPTEVVDILPWCVKIEDAVTTYPPLQKHVTTSGKIDLGDPLALTSYNKAVALALANLRITVPEGKLIPAVCLRHAYVKILAENYLPKNARILDIGTGSSAIIALFAAQLHDMVVVATEIDPSSFASAQVNIRLNKLQHKSIIILPHQMH